MTDRKLTMERIDVRWAVRTRSSYEGPDGVVTVDSSFLVTLGTNSGRIDAGVMADSLNERGVHDGDVDSVTCPGGAPSIAEATAVMAARGIAPEEILAMRIAAVLLDEEEIAEAFVTDDPDMASD